MKNQDREEQRITSEDAWESIHATLDRSRSLMYVAGWPSILLLWGAIVSVGYLTQFVVEMAFPTFADDYPWFPGPLWGVLGTIGMIGSSILGYRAGHATSDGPTAARAGLQVFFFWMTVVTAAYIIPAASGLYSFESFDPAIVGVAVGIVALGYILFGIMHHKAIALMGGGIGAAHYVPSYFAGDLSDAVSAIIMLVVVAIAWTWIRKTSVA